jgi:hypothetical protein
MATPAVTPQPTAWDEQGNPVQPQQSNATGATAWDEQGNPVAAGAGQDQGTDWEKEITNLPVTVAQEVGDTAKGAFDMASAPAKHLGKAIQALAKGNFAEAGTHFLNSLHAAEGGEVADSILQSSKQAKDRMMESAKKGDALGTAQHAAGMVPGASQVDDAMTRYQENPDTKGLVHVIATALPMILPGASRLAKGELAGGAEVAEGAEGPVQKAVSEGAAEGGSAVEAEAAKSVGKAGLEEGTEAKPATTTRTPAREMELAPATKEEIPARKMSTPSKAPEPVDLQPGIRQAMNKVAEKEGLKPIPESTDIRDVPKALSDQLYFRSKAGFDAVKKATGVDINILKDQMYDLRLKIDSTFDNPDLEGKLIERMNALDDQAQSALQEAEKQGVNVRQPLEDWKKMHAASEYGTAVRQSAEGRYGVINPDKYAPKVEKMYRSNSPTQPGRLQQLAGNEVAEGIRNDAYAAQETQEAIKNYKPPTDTMVPGTTIKNPALKLKTPASVTKTEAVPATESKALYDLVRPNVKGKLLTDGARTNWAKVQDSFDALKPEEVKARFKNPEQVRDLIHTQARNQMLKTIAKVGGIGAAASALGISQWMAHRLLE